MKSIGEAKFDMKGILQRSKLHQSATTKWTQSSKPASSCSYNRCDGTGTINTFRWEEDEGYSYNGAPVRHQVAVVKPCQCYLDSVFEKYNASAGMKPNERQRTFETSEIDSENKQAFTQCQRFAENIDHHLEAGTWLYIFGDDEKARKENKSAFGTGKSHLTHCIGNYLTQHKYRSIYVTEDKLFAEIKETYNKGSDESEMDVLWRYEHVPVLLIDDLFKSKTTDWTEDKLFHLLDNRIGPGKVTIINSNYRPSQIELTLPKNGKAIASRIIGQSVVIEMIGRDRRRKQAAKRIREEEQHRSSQ